MSIYSGSMADISRSRLSGVITTNSLHVLRLQNLLAGILKTIEKGPSLYQKLTNAISKLIPEFKSLARAQNNNFHIFPIDVHTLEFIAALSKDPNVKSKLSGEIILAALLHDIGKPASETIKDGKSQYLKHAEKGAKDIAPKILTELGICEGSPAREIILNLIEHHMTLVEKITAAAEGKEGLTDKALGRFVRDTVEPLNKIGIDLDMLLAFGRADLIASQGPECYRRLGVAENDLNALINKIDDAIKYVKERVGSYYQKQNETLTSTSKSITGQDLIKAGFKPGPKFKDILARAAEIERTENLTGEALIARLEKEFPQPV